MPVAQRRAVPRPKARTARVARKTKETDIVVTLGVDGAGKGAIDTGIPFFDHMLDAFSRHGFFDLGVTAKGDIAVDQHHTVEDVGLALGQAFKDALGEKAGIRRFGEAACPLDEALVRITVDLSGRPFLVYNVDIKRARVGNFDTELIHDFLLALVRHFEDCRDTARTTDLSPGSQTYRRCSDPPRKILGDGVAAERQRLQVTTAYQTAQASEIEFSVYGNRAGDPIYAKLFKRGAFGTVPMVLLTHAIEPSSDPLDRIDAVQTSEL